MHVLSPADYLRTRRSSLPFCQFLFRLTFPFRQSTMSGIPNANVTGNIAIRDLDGKYMKVTSSDGLKFANQHFDGTAKFVVQKHNDGKISLKGKTRYFFIPFSFPLTLLSSLTGSNGKIVNYYADDNVKCEGVESGLRHGHHVPRAGPDQLHDLGLPGVWMGRPATSPTRRVTHRTRTRSPS